MADFDDLLDDLKQKRDELRVQVHLASKEIQDEWHQLEEKTDVFITKTQLSQTGDGVGDALGQLGKELKLGYERVRDAIKDA